MKNSFIKKNPQQCMRTPQTPSSTCSYNLRIESYKFEELLDMFHLGYDANIDDLKGAKKIVLRMHPDKSKLPSEYFLFYKKAFEIILEYFREQNKMNQPVPTSETTAPKYQPMEQQDEHLSERMKTTLNDIKNDRFQSQFNDLYEKNMAKKIDDSRNKWFVNNDPLFEFESPASAKDIASKINEVKTKTAAMVQYKGVQDLMSITSAGRYFDEVDDDPNEYVSCDPFSKLKFEDLRKVHRDQTVLAVSERDFEKMQTYGSVDQYNRARGSQDLSPMQDADANRLFAQKEEMLKKQMATQQHAANLKRMEYEQKNKDVLSNFLLLENNIHKR
jgi:hypothetical protein